MLFQQHYQQLLQPLAKSCELGWTFENNFQLFVFATLRAILSIF